MDTRQEISYRSTDDQQVIQSLDKTRTTAKKGAGYEVSFSLLTDYYQFKYYLFLVHIHI